MTLYVIFRHGSNAANQSMRQTAPVGTIVAKNPQDAMKGAFEIIHCYANQTLSVKNKTLVSVEDLNEAQEADELRTGIHYER